MTKLADNYIIYQKLGQSLKDKLRNRKKIMVKSLGHATRPVPILVQGPYRKALIVNRRKT